MSKDSDGIRFFGEIDCNEIDGSIKSHMPAWYHETHIEELRESTSRKERMIERGLVQPDQVPILRNEIAGEKARLKAIEESRPNLEGKHKDMAYKAYKNLEAQIRDSMPTRKETKQGLVNPQEELKRLKDARHISLSPEIAKACGVKAYRGQLTGDQANKCYQILGKALGENTNVERLRRDGNTEAYRSMHDLTQAILKGVEIRNE